MAHLGLNNQNYCQQYEQIFYLANQNDKRTWYFTLCDKNMNGNSEPGQITSNFHKRREGLAFTLKKMNLIIQNLVR